MPSPRSPGQPEAPLPGLPRVDVGAHGLQLPAKSQELRRAREYADQAAASFGFDEAERFAFVVAVNEAVTNAVRHGTPDEAGTISLRVGADHDRLTLEVSDSGPFVTPAVEDEAMPDHGRGFALMAKLVDEVDVQVGPEGTTVRLGKRRHGVLNPTGAGHRG